MNLDEKIFDYYQNYTDKENFDNFIADSATLFIEHFKEKGFININYGRNRVVILNESRNIVIKYPLNYFGIEDNYWENKNQDEFFARNKIIVLPKIGFPLLIMEKIEICGYKNLPGWADWVDCQQVGKNKRGKFKAYDYGYY